MATEISGRQNRIVEASSSGRDSLGGYCWQYPPGVSKHKCLWIWVGPEDVATLSQLHMTYSDCNWSSYDPSKRCWQQGVPSAVSRTLKRRYYLVEKAKNANIIGIVVGTLGVAGFMEVTERIRNLAQGAGKKTYTFLIGKPTPAKLANFPEIDVFVLVADPQGQILDSKEFYAPIITPFEAQLAFQTGRSWTGEYDLGFSSLLSPEATDVTPGSEGPRFFLSDGSNHASLGTSSQVEEGGSSAGAIVQHMPHNVALCNTKEKHLMEVNSAADYLLARREYRGLEAPVMGAERKEAGMILPGQKGRAAHYETEN